MMEVQMMSIMTLPDVGFCPPEFVALGLPPAFPPAFLHPLEFTEPY